MNTETAIFNQFVMNLLSEQVHPNGAKRFVETGIWMFEDIDPLTLGLKDYLFFSAVNQDGVRRSAAREESFETTFADRRKFLELKNFWEELVNLFNDLEFPWEMDQLSAPLPIVTARNLAMKDYLSQIIDSVELAPPSSSLGKVDLSLAKMLHESCAKLI
jgi:hypothetical protein